MKLNRLFSKTLLLGSLIALGLSSTQASVITWNLNPGNVDGNVGGSSHTFTASGYSITALGYDRVSGPDTPHDLYYRASGGVNGLGLTGTSDNELQVDANGSVVNYIQLDLQSILALGATGGQIEVGRVASGESFRFFGSNTQGSIGTQLPGIWDSQFDEDFVSIPDFGDYRFISIASNKGDVLPVAFLAHITPVPELNALWPIVGLLAAVSSTRLLRRRRMARLGAGHS